MTLILDTATTQSFSAHTTEVLRALYQRTIVATCPSPIPSPTPAPTSTPSPSTPTRIATYVTATPDHTGAGADKANVTKAAGRQSSASLVPDLIFLIDSLPSVPTIRPHPNALFPVLAAEPAVPDFPVYPLRPCPYFFHGVPGKWFVETSPEREHYRIKLGTQEHRTAVTSKVLAPWRHSILGTYIFGKFWQMLR
ncbi:hypothetical protein B0H14DRAFT_2592468 [Mycena olivaceomarginata]|nr:hypothetical protein B0H14DRAFT_2592468 [Mycena olivaceomarginata]